ncbi:hypothetical protein [Robiginitomaculum antarcticum]|uniref:hypothetical protein n=1 Tax=Robiginitomaculum antarcticum TaxID=437507 RepID=UPI00037E52B3|nr:hypothetical protein [Robiginitomaculum antarcticum]
MRIVVILITLFVLTHAASAETYNCPDGDLARTDFESGAAQEWPIYQEGAAARVQRQFPITAVTAHSKYFPYSEEYGVAICQYYNHVGVIFQFGLRVKAQSDLSKNYTWRKEYKESNVKNDVVGEEFVQACMKISNNLEYPSIGCSFTLLDEN